MWNNIYFIGNSFWKIYEVRSERGISIFVDYDPRYKAVIVFVSVSFRLPCCDRKFKSFSVSLRICNYYFRAVLDCMVLPLQDKLEDWKKSATTMDKDHAKEYKKLRSEVKKRSEFQNWIKQISAIKKTNNLTLQPYNLCFMFWYLFRIANYQTKDHYKIKNIYIYYFGKS